MQNSKYVIQLFKNFGHVRTQVKRDLFMFFCVARSPNYFQFIIRLTTKHQVLLA
jgi:hypothetical protein